VAVLHGAEAAVVGGEDVASGVVGSVAEVAVADVAVAAAEGVACSPGVDL
jgi:hypothetical protein